LGIVLPGKSRSCKLRLNRQFYAATWRGVGWTCSCDFVFFWRNYFGPRYTVVVVVVVVKVVVPVRCSRDSGGGASSVWRFR